MSLNEYRTIVVGADGSALTIPTVARAAALARHDDADLVVMVAWSEKQAADVIAIGSLGDLPAGVSVAEHKAAEAIMETAVAIADQFGAKVAATLLVNAEPEAALLEIAGRYNADLIVVGAIRDTSIAGRLLGTVATEVVRQAPCEVLVVRPGRIDEAGDAELDNQVAEEESA